MWQAAGSLGPWGGLVMLGGFVTWLVLTGKLVPRSALKDKQSEADYLRTVVDKQLEVTLKQGMSLERLLVLAETSTHALAEIQAAMDPRGQL